MYIRRQASSRLDRLFQQFPAVVVSGARQVGKTTLLRELYGSRAEFVVFDPVADVENARAEPDLFLNHHRTPLVLDEIQYAPEVVPALKRRIDRDRRPGQYLITGSQQWEVLRRLAESLAGRAVFVDLEGFSLSEIAGRSDGASWIEQWLEGPRAFLAARPARLPAARPLFEHLWRGFLPEAELLPLDVVSDFHAAYQRTYLERDVRLLGNVDDWMLFGRFFRLAAALTSQEVNYDKLGRDLGVAPQTARRWLTMLQATFQWHSVPAWSANTTKRVSKAPKGYMSDSGAVCAALRISSPTALADHPALGAIFETAVVGEVRRLTAQLSSKPVLHHWRSHGGAEVDLLLERDGTFYPIEIKASARPTTASVRGIAAFRASHPDLRVAPGLVLSPVDTVTRLSSDDVALPWDVSPVSR